jgi:hypothetical protein
MLQEFHDDSHGKITQIKRVRSAYLFS